MTDQFIPAVPAAPEPQKKTFLKRAWPWAAVLVGGIILGAIFTPGGASADTKSAAPAPTVTVQAEPEPAVTVTAEPVDDSTCQAVAIELFSILNSTVNEITIPYNEITQILVAQLQVAPYIDESEITRATGILSGATDATNTNTARIDAISADYAECTAG